MWPSVSKQVPNSMITIRNVSIKKKKKKINSAIDIKKFKYKIEDTKYFLFVRDGYTTQVLDWSCYFIWKNSDSADSV